MLAGIRVLDLTRVLAGPYCTMLLADMGAEVIKVERPRGGDETRQWGPPFHPNNSESCYFLSVNRNKQSVAINMKSQDGAQLIRKMAEKVDVFIENYVPKHLDKLGLGYSDLSKINPNLVYCSLTGYGQSGKLSSRPGYDVVVASVGGLLSITGPQDGDPCRVGVAMTDISTGLYAHSSILAGLLQRSKTGNGVYIDCNLFSTQISVLSHIAANWLNCGMDGKRWGTGHPSIVPYQAFKTKDNRHVVVGAGNDAAFQKLCDILGLHRLKTDPKFATNAQRVKYRTELLKIIAASFVEKSSGHWEGVFANSGLPFGRVNSISEAMALAKEHDPSSLVTMDPSITVPGPAVKFSKPFLRTDHVTPPTLGQDTFSVLSRLVGLDRKTLEELQKQGVIMQQPQQN